MKVLKDHALGSWLLFFVLISGFIALQGCVSTTREEIQVAETGIGQDEVIAVLRRVEIAATETEQDFLDCVVDRTTRGREGLKVISNDTFVDALYPWFEPLIAPNDVGDLTVLTANAKVKERLDSMDVRYIVWIDGATKRTEQNGTVQCAVATGGFPACFGFLSWRAESLYEAVVWDVERKISVGKLSADSKGMSFVPAVVIPIPFIARTQSSACEALASQLKEFIKGSGDD